jgi:hypothetical protein
VQTVVRIDGEYMNNEVKFQWQYNGRGSLNSVIRHSSGDVNGKEGTQKFRFSELRTGKSAAEDIRLSGLYA